MKLKNKVAIITGSSDGIGKQIALRLAEEEVEIALVARSEKRLEQVKSECEQLGSPKVKYYICDLKDKERIGSAVESIKNDFGKINILINNAGIWQKMMDLDEIHPETIEEVIATNLTAVIHVTQSTLPILREEEDAAIINISSKSGVTAQKGQSVYTASKWGVKGFTDVLKEDLKDTNVRVGAVYQSGTNTKMFEKTEEEVPIDKFTDPADLADVVKYMLLRPEKIWIHEVHVTY
ncbi:SDR family NAD(P)-dependent oxidoreductase [Candidatus Dojkabacteria bacterium]|nr:SDR family NAD(P)-dependent oxidoreductase [Candidatus Dojkabacteria bacterium]